MRTLARLDRTDSGWTFVESIIVIAIIIILSGTVSFSAVRYLEQARTASARAQIAALWEKPTLAPTPDRWNGPYLGRPLGVDPWGSAFVYRRPGPAGLAFEVVSYGADGTPGGSGRDADISSAGR